MPIILTLLKELDSQADPSLEAAEKTWNKMEGYPYFKVFVAVEGKEILGTYSLLTADNLAHNGRRFAIVENVVVRSAHRGKGIGREMMNAAFERAQKEKCYKLMLSSNLKREQAHEFYDGIGFDRHGISFRVELSTP